MPTISESNLSTLLVHLVRQHVRTRWIVRHHKAGRGLLLMTGKQIRELIDSGNVDRDRVASLFRMELEHQRQQAGGGQ
jgi:hypothetical protein